MRGYRRLRASGELSRISRLREALTVRQIDEIGRRASPTLFGAGVASAEVVVRQFALTRFASVTLVQALLRAVGRREGVVHPLPARWRDIVEEHGFRVSRVRSALLWNGCVVLYAGFGAFTMLRKLVAGIKATLTSAPELGRHVVFDTLPIGALPRPASDGRSFDVISWYDQWPARIPDLDAMCHGASVPPTKARSGTRVVTAPIIPMLVGWTRLVRFAAWSAAATGVAIVGILGGRWWHSLLMKEAADAAIVRFQPAGRLAREYLFHNSGWVYRPLWTHEAARSGARISLYFYSTNTEAFRLGAEYPPVSYGYAAMAWPHYIVWDDYQADFIRRAVGADASISVAGPIWFQGSSHDLEPLPAKTVAVFDVQPVRNSFYQGLGLEQEYYLPATSLAFLGGIIDATRRVGARVAFKRKREMGSLAHPRYRRFVQRLDERSNVTAIQPEAAAHRLIESSAAVLSMAFTSTAIIGRDLGKPSAYYDPTGLLRNDDRAAHGIPVLSGPAELEAWLAAALGEAPAERMPRRAVS